MKVLINLNKETSTSAVNLELYGTVRLDNKIVFDLNDSEDGITKITGTVSVHVRVVDFLKAIEHAHKIEFLHNGKWYNERMAAYRHVGVYVYGIDAEGNRINKKFSTLQELKDIKG